MLIGILEAETLHPRVVAQFGSYADMFINLLSAFDPNLKFKRYAADEGILPRSVEDCAAYIVTGSRHNSYDDDPWIVALRTFIQELHQSHKKVLGICFGHQVIAQALGGKVEKNHEGWGIGATEFSVSNHPPWVPTAIENYSVLVSHQDQVVDLPPEAKLLSSNSFCPIGAYYIDGHVFCLQGHPEFTTDYLMFLMNKREDQFPPQQYKLALASLSHYQAQPMITQWILRFFYEF